MSEAYWCSTAPNVPRIWSSSSLATLAACPRKFELSYVEGWVGKEDNLDFAFGSAFHDGIEAYWTWLHSGLDKAEALDRAIVAAWQMDLPVPTRAKQAGKTKYGLARALVEYSDTYSDNPQDLVLLDGKLALEVPFSFMLPRQSPDGEPYKVQGYLDQIRMFGGVYTVVDYKTTSSSLSDFYFQKFEISFQNYLYSAASTIITGQMVTQFLIDAVAVLPSGKVDVLRRPVQLTPGEVEEGLIDIQEQILLAEHYASRNYWPKNPESCTFCPFNQVCNKDPEVRIGMLQSDFVENRRTEATVRNAHPANA